LQLVDSAFAASQLCVDACVYGEVEA
jgi:hypothetical protein